MWQPVRALSADKPAARETRLSGYSKLSRTESGSVLIETMVSILIATALATALIKMYVNIHQGGNAARGQVMAAAMAQEVFDQLRALPYETVDANVGLHTVQVNGTGAGDALFPGRWSWILVLTTTRLARPPVLWLPVSRTLFAFQPRPV